ncbi:aromatic ring-hydroxylating dioxygenase subunit alpha [Streptomyces sp. NPDC091215]|uniref:aromatic ring-hydroxylating oxygenase subunit alpha n=1 Tax=Streptomyces sp. NPDC091215 TaxID=3155192 RepID=UPI00342A5991
MTVADAASIPALTHADYTSMEVFEAEIERLFRRRWLYVCHLSDLPETGSFRQFRLGGDSVVVVRQPDGGVAAVHNVCRHRGAPLLDADSGTCRRAISCSYHGWTYGLDGALRGTPKMPGDIDTSQLGLRRAGADVWNGLVFVCLDGQPAETVAQQLAAVDLSAYGLSRTKVAFESETVLQANWKVGWENGLECYHCAINHPELKQVAEIERNGPPPTMLESAEFKFDTEFPVYGVSVTTSGQVEGKQLGEGPDLPSTVAFLSWHLSVFELIASPDHVHLMTYMPLTPSTTLLRTVGLVHEDAEAGVDYDPVKLFEVHRITRDQDNALCELVQRGVQSPAFVPGPFNPMYEFENMSFVTLYREVMGGAD